MDFQIAAPPEILKPFIKYFWMLNNPINGSEQTLTAYPDGCPGLIMFELDNAGICDSQHKKLPGIYLHGQTIGPAKLSCTSGFSVIGISFYPHALRSIFGMDASELTHTGIDLNLALQKKYSNLNEQLLNAESTAGKIKLLSDYLVDEYQHNNRQTENAINYAITQIIQSKGNIPLKELQQQLRLSERSLERKFSQSIGISPKLFSRICRFQGSLNQMKAKSYDKLTDIAYANDYADQSHLIRTFKEFTGISPLEFQKQQIGIENLIQANNKIAE